MSWVLKMFLVDVFTNWVKWSFCFSLLSPQIVREPVRWWVGIALLQSMKPTWRIRSQERHQAISRGCWSCCCRSVSCCVMTFTSRCTYHFLLTELGSGWARCWAGLAVELSHFRWHTGSALGSLVSHFHITESKNFCDACGCSRCCCMGFWRQNGKRTLTSYRHVQAKGKNKVVLEKMH